MSTSTLTGQDALHALVSTVFATVAGITETDAGIDVDGTGGRYEREIETDYEGVLWSVMNHIAFYGTDNITARIANDKLETLHVIDPQDSESYGTTYAFTYA